MISTGPPMRRTCRGQSASLAFHAARSLCLAAFTVRAYYVRVTHIYLQVQRTRDAVSPRFLLENSTAATTTTTPPYCVYTGGGTTLHHLTNTRETCRRAAPPLLLLLLLLLHAFAELPRRVFARRAYRDTFDARPTRSGT